MQRGRNQEQGGRNLAVSGNGGVEVSQGAPRLDDGQLSLGN